MCNLASRSVLGALAALLTTGALAPVRKRNGNRRGPWNSSFPPAPAAAPT